MSWEVNRAMRSRTSYFNLSLFWKTVCRFWPVWALYAIVWAMAMPMALGGNLSGAVMRGSEMQILRALRYMPLRGSFSTGTPINAFFALFTAMAVYSHLYNPRSAGAYASLPINREGVFCSVTLAGLVPLTVINLLAFGAAFLVEAAYGVMYAPALLQGLAISLLTLLFFFGFAALCAQLTGNMVVLPFVYVILNFAAYAVEYALRSVMELIVYGFNNYGSDSFAQYFSPAIAISSNCGVDSAVYETSGSMYGGQTYLKEVSEYLFHGWELLGVYAAIGAALIVCALLVYRRRRMETAGDVVAVRQLKPVFKYCMAVGCALCLSLLLYAILFGTYVFDPLGTPAVLLMLMLLGCFIGYFAAEMLLKKSFSVFRGRVWRGFAITCALLIALMISFETDLWGYEKRVPEAGNVESVTLNAGGESSSLTEPRNIEAALALHRSIVANKAMHEAPEAAEYTRLRLTYTLKDGSSLLREYELSYDKDGFTADMDALESIVNTPEAIYARKATGYPITEENIGYADVRYAYLDESSETGWTSTPLELTAAEANELYYDCILPDIRDCTLGRIWLIDDEEYLNTVYDCNIGIECTEYERGPGSESGPYHQYFYTVPTVDSVRTNAWLEEHGVILDTLAETREAEMAYYEKYEKDAYENPIYASAEHYK